MNEEFECHYKLCAAYMIDWKHVDLSFSTVLAGGTQSRMSERIPTVRTGRRYVTSLGKGLTLGATLRILVHLVAASASFCLMPYFVNRVGDDAYGIWTVVGSFGKYWSLLDLGFGTAIARYLSGSIGAGDTERSTRLFGTAMILCSGVTVIILMSGGAGSFFASFFCRTGSDCALFRVAVAICAVTSALLVWYRSFTATLTCGLHYGLAGFLDLIMVLLRPLLMLGAVAYGLGMLGMAWGALFGVVPSLLLSLWMARRRYPFVRLPITWIRRCELPGLTSYSVFALLGRAGDVFRYQLDAPLVSSLLGDSAVTHYRVAEKAAIYAMQALSPALEVFQPLFSHQQGQTDYKAIQKTYLFATRVSISMSSFIGFALIVWGKPFIVRWMGPAYLDAYPCLTFLAVAYALALSQAPSVSLLYGVSRHRRYAMLNWTEGGANLLFSILLSRRYGIVGIAMGKLLPSVILRALVVPTYTCYVAGVRHLDYLWASGRAVLVALVSLIFPFVLSRLMDEPSYARLLSVAFASVCFYAAMQWFLAFNAKERELLIGVFRKSAHVNHI